MREVYCVDQSMMNDWRQICKAYANQTGAELLFVNESSCGVCYQDGTMRHIYIDEMEALLRA